MKDNIIYIDDEQANLDAFRMVFGDKYNVILCVNAKEVFNAINENEIKVLVSDQRMPTITGLDLCKRVNKIDPEIVCIILTAFADVGVTVQALNQGGIYRYMLKPWNKEEMGLSLVNAIDKFNLKAENNKLVEDLEKRNKELKEKAIAIKASEAQLNVIFESTPLILLLVNEDLVVERVNKAGLEVGNKTEKETLGFKPGDILNCINSLKNDKGCGNSEECKTCVARNTVLKTFENSENFQKIEVSLSLIINDKIYEREALLSTNFLDNGEEKKVLVSVDDITDQNLEKKELKLAKENSEKNLRDFKNQKRLTDTIVKNSQIGFAMHEIDSGKVIYINNAFRKAYKLPDYVGFTVEDFFEYVYADNMEQGQKILDDIQSNDINRLQWLKVPLKDKTGKLFYVSAWNIPLFEQNMMISTVLDVTSQRIAELTLIENSTKQDAMISNISDVIGILSKEGKILYKSPNITKFFGWTQEEMIGADALSAIHPDDLEMIQKEFFQLLEKDNNQTNVEYRYRCKNGTYKSVQLTAVNLVNNPSIKGVLINYHDISDRKLAEMEIVAMNEELRATSDVLKENEATLELKNKELTKAKEKAEESDRLKSSFLANMSHEIRTPLNGIMGFAQLLLKENLPKDKLSNFLNIIFSNSQQLLSIVNDILDISKIETGQVVLRIDKVDINSLMDELFEFHALQAKNKDLGIEIYRDKNEEFVINSDRTKLYQVLNNLISNALKFTEKGKIKFGYKINLDNIEFFVEDTGIGISGDIQSRIFDRFYQGDSSSIRFYGGNGLGLTITKSLVELMNGNIKVESKLGHGSKFIVNLPVQDILN